MTALVLPAGVLRSEDDPVPAKKAATPLKTWRKVVPEVGPGVGFNVPDDYQIKVLGGGLVQMEGTDEYVFRKIEDQNKRLEKVEGRLKDIEAALGGKTG